MVEGEMRAGAARAAIDLEDVLPFDGFDVLRHEIFARALVVEAMGRRACILSLEVTSIAPALLTDLREDVKEVASCDGAFSWVVPTHTFSVPHVRTPGHLVDDAARDRNERYRAALVGAARAAVEQAVAGIRPVTLATAAGCCPVNVNRDVETPAGWWLGADPEGFSDHSMPVVAMRDAGGELVAVLASADVQSSVLDGSCDSEGRRVVNGDLFGFAATALERELGGVALLLPGAAGDQGPAERAVTVTFDAAGAKRTDDAHEDGYRMLHRQGRALGDALIGAVRAARENDAVGIDASTVDVLLPAQTRTDFCSLAPHRAYEFHEAGEQRTRVYLLRLGKVEFVGIQPEVSSSFGAAVRAARPGSVFFATLVNGGQKYLPAPDAYEKITYEAMNSGFAAGSHERLLETILAALDAA